MRVILTFTPSFYTLKLGVPFIHGEINFNFFPSYMHCHIHDSMTESKLCQCSKLNGM